MSELRSALETFQATDLTAVPDSALEEGFEELLRATEVLEVERLRWLAALDRRQPFARDGFLSTSTWLGRTHRVAYSNATGDVRMARALEAMTKTREAVVSGDISVSAARVLVAAREVDKEAFTEAEPLLVEAAARHSVRDLNRVVAHWRNGVESRRLLEHGEDSLRDRRGLHASRTVFGMVRLDSDLDPETGEPVLTALQSAVDAEIRSGDPDDRRTPAQRRADALAEICRQWLESSNRSQVGGERPHIMVTMSMEALQARSDECELEHVGPVHAEIGRRLACDSTVSRVILNARSEPLDIGRRSPVVTAPMRRALIVRDRGCRFPSCDRPPAWCDAHHVVHWAGGGATALSNLVLLCRRHHRSVHHGFTVEIDDGHPVFRRPDGTRMEERAPP